MQTAKYSAAVSNPKSHDQEDNAVSRLGFTVQAADIKSQVFIPSYYNPETSQLLERISKGGRYRTATLGDLVKEGLLSTKRGNEVGSQYYGMGEIPFVRTSDIVNWEIKIDPVKSVPEEIYQKYKRSQDIRENDILLVSDGTFLIGRVAIVTALDQKLIIQSHVKRIRCLKPSELHPFLLLYLLTTNIVQRQIQEKTFVQATISTLGSRLLEVAIPIPTQSEESSRIVREVSEIMKLKVDARRKTESLIKESL